MRKMITLSLLVLSPCIHAWGQTGFDPGVYSTYLKTNRDLTCNQLLSRYPAGMYYQDRLFPAEPYNYAYFDSIVHDLGITEDELALLAKNKFVVTERLSYKNMVVALDDIFHKDLPVFITTDFILNALHLAYDDILMDLEESILEPNLHEILSLMRDGYPALEAKYGQVEGLDTALKDVDIYLTVALSLSDSTRYTPQSAEIQQVDTILDAIYAEDLFEYTLFSDRTRYLDFSQFRPRGHYTDPLHPWGNWKTLGNYFRTMMWLGRTEFFLTPPPPTTPDLTPWSKEDVKRMNLAAFLLQELLESSGAMDPLLENDGIIGFLVGESDNLTPWEYGRIISSIPGLNSAEQLLSDEVYDYYYELVSGSLEAEEKILSCIFYSNPYDPEPEQLPVSYRLFGQRFVIDSYILANVVYDRIIYQGAKIWRGLPDPLDAMFVLGNNNAGELLQPQIEEYHYASQLDALRYLVNSYDEDFWNKSYYNTWLQSIRDLNPAEEEAGTPWFMKTVAWQHEKLNTQLASWTQLRHDNLLYAKQSYTWGAICSFPHSYVEPYPEFYRRIEGICDAAYTFFSGNARIGYSITSYFNGVRNLMQQLAEIAEKELRLEPLNEDEITFLKGMLHEPENECAPLWAGWFVDLYYDMDKLFWMDDYVIADVHTQATDEGGGMIGKILHVGTGKVNLGIFLAGSPSGNYKPVAFVGPCMSYYEHTTLGWDRKTDEWWAATVNSGFPQRPDWTNVYLANSAGSEKQGGLRLQGSLYEEKDGAGTEVIRQGSVNIYPNPVTGHAVLFFNLSENAIVRVEVYDLMGRKADEIFAGFMTAGDHHVEWTPAGLKPGMYYAVMKAGSTGWVLKIIKQ